MLKVSLTIFFLRIVIRPWQRAVIWAAFTLYTFYGIVYFFFAVFQCRNPAQFFINVLEGRCLSFGILLPMGYVQSALNAVTDWVFAILPLFVLWRAQLPLRAKVTACACLLLGTLGSISSVVRIFYVHGLAPSSEFFQQAGRIGIWSTIEPGLGIIAASLATLRPLCKSCLDRARSGIRSAGNRSSTPSRNNESPRLPLPPRISLKQSFRLTDGWADGFYAKRDDMGMHGITTTTVVGDYELNGTPSGNLSVEHIPIRKADPYDPYFPHDIERRHIPPLGRAASRIHRDMYDTHRMMALEHQERLDWPLEEQRRSTAGTACSNSTWTKSDYS